MALDPLDPKEPRKDPNGDPIFVPPAGLEPGDVLLSYGDPKPGSVSWWIRKLDGGWFSHASYFDGTELVEATAAGVQATPTGVRVHGQEYVDVYRFVSDGRDRLGDPGWEADPIHRATRAYMGRPFAYHDLVFAGLLVVTRRANLPGGLEDHLRTLLSRAVSALRRLLFGDDREHMICSELVFRGFREAAPPKRYRLKLAPLFPEALAREFEVLRKGPPDPSDTGTEAEIRRLEHEFAGLYLAHKAGRQLTLDPSEIELPAAKKATVDLKALDPVAGYVTPRDLERTPNLEEVGRARKRDYPSP